MIVDNSYLYLGFASHWDEVIRNDKLPLQTAIFVDGLIVILVLLNNIETLAIRTNRFSIKLIKTIITVLVIYASNWIIYLFLDLELNCLYHTHRGISAIPFGMSTVLILTIFLIGLELLTKSKILQSHRFKVEKLIPRYLKKQL